MIEYDILKILLYNQLLGRKLEKEKAVGGAKH